MDGRKDYRVEMDSVGAKDVPENVYYGVQSMRAAENFQITGLNMPGNHQQSCIHKKGGGNHQLRNRAAGKKDGGGNCTGMRRDSGRQVP